MSEINCLLSQPFPKSSTAGGKSLLSAPCAGIKQREAGRSRKASCAPMRFNSPRPGSKSYTFCNLCLAKNQRASGRLFLHADYLVRRQERFAPALLYAIAITGFLSSSAFNTSFVSILSPHLAANSKTTAFILLL